MLRGHLTAYLSFSGRDHHGDRDRDGYPSADCSSADYSTDCCDCSNAVYYSNGDASDGGYSVGETTD